MKLLARLSIAQTAALSVLGGLLSASAFLLLMLLRQPLRAGVHSAEWFAGIGFFALLLGGLALSLRAESSITNGIAAQRWPDSQVDSLRRILRSPWSVAFSVLVLIVFIVCSFAVHQRGIAWMVFLLGQTVSRLAIAVRDASKPRDPNPLTQWRTWSRISSSHWGER